MITRFVMTPGAILHTITERLGGKSWSKIAEETGINVIYVRDILYNNIPITEEYAEKLANAYKDTTKEYWLEKEKQYQEHKNDCVVINTRVLEDLEENGYCIYERVME